ncbi:hypothetical protein [Nocardia sp. NPDC005745]|uniref:hypothetical protein n=1 Tax=Nocardia sp. NPDC005745 TaxID=3157061 RepID=UPI0033D61723
MTSFGSPAVADSVVRQMHCVAVAANIWLAAGRFRLFGSAPGRSTDPMGAIPVEPIGGLLRQCRCKKREQANVKREVLVTEFDVHPCCG